MKTFLLTLLGCISIASSQTIILDSPIEIKTDSIVIDGEKIERRLKDGANCPMIIVGDPDHTEPTFRVKNVVIRNFILDGNREKQTNEIYVSHPNAHDNFMRNNAINIRGAENVIIENCVIRNARSGSICIEKSSRKITIRNCILEGSEFDGIAGYISTDCVIESNHIANNKGAGLSFDLNFNRSVIFNNIIINNDIGAFVRDCRDLRFFGNVFENRSFDLYFNKTKEHPETTLPERIDWKQNIYKINHIEVK